MNAEIVIILVFVSLLFFLLLGIPVAFSLFGLAMMVALIIAGPKMLQAGYITAFNVMTKELYIALPLFVFMAGVLEFSGIVSDLYDMAHKWFGPVRGGLAIATIFCSVLIDAISGLSGTAVLTLGILAMPEMFKRGYDKNLVLGCIPAGGALGPVIPPSVIMIILGSVTQLSIGKLFIAGVIPGLIIAAFFCIYILIACFLKPSMAPALPPEERANWRTRLKSLRFTIAPLSLILLVLGSIYSGITTITEAAAVGAIGAIICSIINRRLSWKNMKKAMFMTLEVTCMVFWLVIGGIAFGHILQITGVAKILQEAMLNITSSPIILIIIMQLVGIFLGLFIDASAIIFICVPIFWPLIINFPGIDPLWWGLIFTLIISLGVITPPFGFNLFYLKGIAPKEVTLTDIYRASLPFSLVYLAGVVICFIFPSLVLWLPNLAMK